MYNSPLAPRPPPLPSAVLDFVLASYPGFSGIARSQIMDCAFRNESSQAKEAALDRLVRAGLIICRDDGVVARTRRGHAAVRRVNERGCEGWQQSDAWISEVLYGGR